MFDRPYRKAPNYSLRWISSCQRWIEHRKTTKKLSGKQSGPKTPTAKPMRIWTSRGPTSRSNALTRPSKVTSAMTTKTSTPSSSRKPTSFRRVIIRCVGKQTALFYLFPLRAKIRKTSNRFWRARPDYRPTRFWDHSQPSGNKCAKNDCDAVIICLNAALPRCGWEEPPRQMLH